MRTIIKTSRYMCFMAHNVHVLIVAVVDVVIVVVLVCDKLPVHPWQKYRIHRHCVTGNWHEGKKGLQRFPRSFVGVTSLVMQRGGHANAARSFVKQIPLDKVSSYHQQPFHIRTPTT